MLTAELQLADLVMEMNHLLGLRLDTRLDLAPVAPANLKQGPCRQYARNALGSVRAEQLLSVWVIRTDEKLMILSNTGLIAAMRESRRGIDWLDHVAGGPDYE